MTLRTVLATIFKNYDLKWVDQKEDGQLPAFKLSPGLPYPTTPTMVVVTPRKP